MQLKSECTVIAYRDALEYRLAVRMTKQLNTPARPYLLELLEVLVPQGTLRQNYPYW